MFYEPWSAEPYVSLFRSVAGKTVIGDKRLYVLYNFARSCSILPGGMAECGVYKGGSASIILQAAPGIILDLYDTFYGMPEAANSDPSLHRAGDFGDVNLQEVKTFLSPHEGRIRFHQGIFPTTFEKTEDRFSFVHIDVDLYQSAMDCCSYFYPKMISGGIILFDDYGFEFYKDSERLAVDRYFLDKTEEVITLMTGQAFVICRGTK